MDSGVPVYMATASVSIEWWMCHCTLSVAPQVACAIGISLLVERVLHSAGPRALHVDSTTGNSLLVALVLHSAEARTVVLGCSILPSVMVLVILFW
eukprot:3487520-Pyramimonas_sp.AAC.1